MRQEIHGDPLIVNKWLPEDLRISSVIPVNGKLPSLNASVNAARYLFTPVDPLSVDYMQKRADAILGSSSVTVQISKGAENEEKELRHLIKSLKVIQHNGSPAWEALISLVSGGTCKPSELLSVLCPELPAAGFRILRIECIFSLSR